MNRHRTHRIRWRDFALAAVLAGATAPAAGQSRGGVFDFGVGGRSLGMGGACVAACRDVTALYYNPAGLALLEGRQVQAMRATLYGDGAYDYAGYAQNFADGFRGFGLRMPFSGRRRAPSGRARYQGGWGLQILRLNVSGGTGRSEDNAPSGGFSYAETGLGLGFGVRGVFLPRLSLGAAVKTHTRSLGPSSDKMMALDLGAQYGPFLDDRLNLGLVVQNAVSRLHGDTTDEAAVGLRAGAAYRLFGPLTAAFDMSQSGELRAGAEYSLGAMALRLGYSPEGMTFGTGYVWKKALILDLAMVNNPALGLSQRASLGWRFGTKKPRKLSKAALEYFKNGLAAVERGDYVRASSDLEAAYGLDPSVGPPEWKAKAARLKALLAGIDMREARGLKDLKEDSEAGRLARRAVSALLDGDDGQAMLLAHVAAGTAGQASAYTALLRSVASLTLQEIRREDVAPAGAFVQDRFRRCGEAIPARRYDAAAKLCQDAVAVRPEDATAWTRLGSAHYAAGRKPKALEAYRKALELDPGDARLQAFVRQNFKD